MAELVINFSLTEFLDILSTKFRDQFGDFYKEYIFYPLRTDLAEGQYDNLPLPAMFVDLMEMSPGADLDQKTEQLGVNLMFCAHLVFPMDYPNVQVTMRIAAAQVAQFIFVERKFGAPVDRSVIHEIVPDDEVMGDTDRFCAWMVTWSHKTLLSNSIFDVPNLKGTDNFFSYAPKIGLNHIQDYKRVE